MALKAVLFDFNGVMLDDELIHRQLIEDILLAENLSVQRLDFQQYCLGRSDRTCLKDLLTSKGRVATEAYLEKLIASKAKAYIQQLDALEKLPLFPGLEDLIFKLRVAQIKMAVVSGALRSEVKEVLQRAKLAEYFPVIVAAEDTSVSKPEPTGYLLAMQRLAQKYPALKLKPTECLAIEDTLTGIEAAKRAGIPVVGVAHTYPFHMLQRLANWTVDYLHELEIDRIQEVFTRPAKLTSQIPKPVQEV
jgi:HAD superfamily hydrolase (TIGR01509 family)